MEGMDMIIDEGPGYHPPLPPNFPTCHSFQWSHESFQKYRRDVHESLKAKTSSRDRTHGDISSFDIHGKWCCSIKK